MTMTKTEIQEKAKAILNSTRILHEVNKEDFVFLIKEVFCKHPFWNYKTKGQLIVGIHVNVSPEHWTKCFYITRMDGTSTDIGLAKCFRKASDETVAACREAIRPIIEKFRSELKYPFICPVTGEVLSDPSEVHIDHYDETFIKVVRSWIETKSTDELQLKPPKDNQSAVRFLYAATDIDFINYHNSHTHLRAVSVTANLSILKRKAA
jgi:hypothetical protein